MDQDCISHLGVIWVPSEVYKRRFKPAAIARLKKEAQIDLVANDKFVLEAAERFWPDHVFMLPFDNDVSVTKRYWEEFGKPYLQEPLTQVKPSGDRVIWVKEVTVTPLTACDFKTNRQALKQEIMDVVEVPKEIKTETDNKQWLSVRSRPPSQNQPKPLPPDDAGPLQLPARIHIKLPAPNNTGQSYTLFGQLLYTDANYGESRFTYGPFKNLAAGMFMQFPDPDILFTTGKTEMLTFYRSTAAYQRLRKSKQGKGLEAICFSDKLTKTADANEATRPDSHYYNLLDYARPGIGFIQDPTFTKERRDALAMEARKNYVRSKFVVVLAELDEEMKRNKARADTTEEKKESRKRKEGTGAASNEGRRTKRSRPSFQDVRLQARLEVIAELNMVKTQNIIHRAIALYSSFWKEAPVFSNNIEALQLVETRFAEDGPWKNYNFSLSKGDVHDQWTKVLCAWMLMLPREQAPPSVERVSQLLDVIMGKAGADKTSVSALPPLA